MTEKIAINKKGEVALSTGSKVKLKEMSIDDVDFCSDIAEIKYNENGDVTGVRNVSKSRTAWIRRGIAGGEFKDFSFNVKGHLSDRCLMELNEIEKNELVGLIQEYQILGE